MKKITLFILCLSTLLSGSQNVVFTIENATTSGATITETVIQNGNTYVLTAINTSGATASIFNFGGFQQFRSFDTSAVMNASWQISITENGTPLNFTFGSVDYLTIGQGTYNITNDNGDVITNDIVLNLGGSRGTLSADDTNNAADIDGFNINGITIGTVDALSEVAFHNIEINPETLSIDSNEIKQINIFPNPSLSEVNINTGNSLVKNVIIYDLKGNFIKEVNTTSKINISDIKSGLYLLKISENNKSTTIKLMVN